MFVSLFMIFIVVSTSNCQSENVCPGGLWHYEPTNVCLGYDSDAVTFISVKNFCQEAGGKVLQITSRDMNDFILARLSGLGALSDFWIGVDDEDDDGTFKYTDGTSLGEYKPWTSDPAVDSSGNQCVRGRLSISAEYMWDITNCNEQHTIMCEIALETPVPTCPVWGTLNPDGDACIKVVKGHRRTFGGAKWYCERIGGSLATKVSTKEERKHIMRQAKFRAHFWIGYRSLTEDGVFTDLNGTPTEASAPFKRAGTNGHCVTIKQGRWYSKKCNKARFFICQRDPAAA